MIKRILTAVLVRLINGLSSAAPDDPISQRIRVAAYRLLQCRIGSRSVVMGGTYINGFGVTIGHGTFISRNVYFDLNSPVFIGSRVHIASNVKFITSTHEVGDPSQRAGRLISAPISIGDGAWIGAGAIILPGVQVGAGCIIAAGAVVTRSVPEDTVVGGVPARVIRTLSDDVENDPVQPARG